MSEKVAVILVNYESGDELTLALYSLKHADRPPDIFVVVDNASQDGSLEKASLMHEMHVIRNHINVGFAAAVNQGLILAQSTGATHVWLLNPDARVRSGTLRFLVEASRRFPRALLSPAIFDQQGRPWFTGGIIRWWRMHAVHKTEITQGVVSEEFLTGCALFMPIAAFKRVGFFDERFFLYYEDADYSVRARRAGFTLHVVPEALVDHREGSRFHPQKVYFLVVSGLLFFDKYAGGWSKIYFQIYVTIRRLKNWLDCLLFGGKEAMSVRQAYGDFFRKTRETKVLAHRG